MCHRFYVLGDNISAGSYKEAICSNRTPLKESLIFYTAMLLNVGDFYIGVYGEKYMSFVGFNWKFVSVYTKKR